MNAKEELQEILKTQKEKGNVLVCAEISYEGRWGDNGKEEITLSHPHTKEEADAFFKALDFKYDAGRFDVGIDVAGSFVLAAIVTIDALMAPYCTSKVVFCSLLRKPK
jgi:hypothetical protein